MSHHTKQTKCCSVCALQQIRQHDGLINVEYIKSLKEHIKSKQLAPVYYINFYTSDRKLKPAIQLPYLNFEDTIWVAQFLGEFRYEINVELTPVKTQQYEAATFNSTNEKCIAEPWNAVPLILKKSGVRPANSDDDEDEDEKEYNEYVQTILDKIDLLPKMCHDEVKKAVVTNNNDVLAMLYQTFQDPARVNAIKEVLDKFNELPGSLTTEGLKQFLNMGEDIVS